MKKLLVLALAVLGVALAAPSVASAYTCGYNSGTYLHVECAEASAKNWVQYDNGGVVSAPSVVRQSNTRVDVYVKAIRAGRYQCRWVIVRGPDNSNNAVYSGAWELC